MLDLYKFRSVAFVFDASIIKSITVDSQCLVISDVPKVLNLFPKNQTLNPFECYGPSCSSSACANNILGATNKEFCNIVYDNFLIFYESLYYLALDLKNFAPDIRILNQDWGSIGGYPCPYLLESEGEFNRRLLYSRQSVFCNFLYCVYQDRVFSGANFLNRLIGVIRTVGLFFGQYFLIAKKGNTADLKCVDRESVPIICRTFSQGRVLKNLLSHDNLNTPYQFIFTDENTVCEEFDGCISLGRRWRFLSFLSIALRGCVRAAFCIPYRGLDIDINELRFLKYLDPFVVDFELRFLAARDSDLFSSVTKALCDSRSPVCFISEVKSHQGAFICNALRSSGMLSVSVLSIGRHLRKSPQLFHSDYLLVRSQLALNYMRHNFGASSSILFWNDFVRAPGEVTRSPEYSALPSILVIGDQEDGVDDWSILRLLDRLDRLDRGELNESSFSKVVFKPHPRDSRKHLYSNIRVALATENIDRIIEVHAVGVFLSCRSAVLNEFGDNYPFFIVAPSVDSIVSMGYALPCKYWLIDTDFQLESLSVICAADKFLNGDQPSGKIDVRRLIERVVG